MDQLEVDAREEDWEKGGLLRGGGVGPSLSLAAPFGVLLPHPP